MNITSADSLSDIICDYSSWLLYDLIAGAVRLYHFLHQTSEKKAEPQPRVLLVGIPRSALSGCRLRRRLAYFLWLRLAVFFFLSSGHALFTYLPFGALAPFCIFSSLVESPSRRLVYQRCGVILGPLFLARSRAPSRYPVLPRSREQWNLLTFLLFFRTPPPRA